MRGGNVFAARPLYLKMQRQLMIGAVDFEYTVHIDLRLALGSKLAVDVVGHEGRQGITLALKDLIMHAVIARLAPTRAAGDVHNDLARGFAGIGIKVKGAALELERPMHRVQHVMQRELDVGFRRIQLQRHRTRGRHAQQKQEDDATHRHEPPASAQRSPALPRTFEARADEEPEIDRAAA